MNLYELLLFVHLAAVICWIGGAVMFTILGSRGAKAGPPDPQRVIHTAEQAEWLGTRFYTPLAIVTLLAGIGMVLESGIGFDHLWVLIGLTMIIIAGALGGAFYSKNTKALVQGINERGFDEGAQAILKKIVTVSKVELVLLFIVVLVMVTKPEL
ncbi:MAG TPA: DUF2269 family protein [Actinomycetota bacterium]|nr:DUF2269 family protein [Actinomycetota bacterium]